MHGLFTSLEVEEPREGGRNHKGLEQKPVTLDEHFPNPTWKPAYKHKEAFLRKVKVCHPRLVYIKQDSFAPISQMEDPKVTSHSMLCLWLIRNSWTCTQHLCDSYSTYTSI